MPKSHRFITREQAESLAAVVMTAVQGGIRTSKLVKQLPNGACLTFSVRADGSVWLTRTRVHNKTTRRRYDSLAHFARAYEEEENAKQP